MRKQWASDALAHAIDETVSEIQLLADEMRDAFEATPDSLKGSSVGQRRDEAACALEVSVAGVINIPNRVKNEQVEWIEKVGKLYRPARRDNAVSCLQSCINRLSAQPEHDDDTRKLIIELQRTVSMLCEVYFPGMSGR